MTSLTCTSCTFFIDFLVSLGRYRGLVGYISAFLFDWTISSLAESSYSVGGSIACKGAEMVVVRPQSLAHFWLEL